MGAGPRMQGSVAGAGLLDLVDQTIGDTNNYESGEPGTTDAAVSATKDVLDDSEIQQAPNVDIVPYEGGILVVWRKSDRHVRLFCSASTEHKSYIYESETKNKKTLSSRITHDVNRANLKRSLRWMQGIE